MERTRQALRKPLREMLGSITALGILRADDWR